MRLVLAATLSPSYGIYSGYELCENEAVPGTEEYLNSEKYEIRTRDWHAPGNINEFIARLNAIRRENPCLRLFTNLHFLETDNDQILFYAKATPDGGNIILVAVNLDPAAAALLHRGRAAGSRGRRAGTELWRDGPGDRFVVDLGRAQLRAAGSRDRAGPHSAGYETHMKNGNNNGAAQRSAVVQGRDLLRAARALVL